MQVSLKRAQEMVNFNYVGIAAAILSIIVAGYNINQYYKTIRKGE